MSWLSKAATIALKVTEIVTGLGPLASAIIPGDKDDKIIQAVSVDLAQIAQIIAQVEIFGQALGLPGAQKLTAAAPSVAQVILQSSIMAKHEISNPELFKTGCTKVADGMADVLNSLKDKVESQNKAS
jgi:hypothetical protein